MADTTFTAGTVIASTWLNDVNDFVYNRFVRASSTCNFDGTDESAKIQALVDECLLASPPLDLVIDGAVTMGASVNIDRAVDTTTDMFTIYGVNGGGFIASNNTTLFTSSLAYVGGTSPSSEHVTFKGLRFSTSSVFNTSYVASSKFVRIAFDSCFFWIIKAHNPSIGSVTATTATNKLTVTAVSSGTIVDTTSIRATDITAGTYIVSQDSGTTGGVGVYTLSTTPGTLSSRTVTLMTFLQSWTFINCTIRNWLGSFVDCAGSYDMLLDDCRIEAGSCVVSCVDGARGTNGLRVVNSLLELLGESSLKLTGCAGFVYKNNHVENNVANDINTFAGPLTNSSVDISDNYVFNPNGAFVYHGTTTSAVSVANTVSGAFHTNTASVTSLISIGDTAGTLSDTTFTTYMGRIKTKGAFGQTVATPTYSASISLNPSTATTFVITATNSTPFTITAGGDTTVGQPLKVTVKNTSGGALGTLTFDSAAFKAASWTQPANGFRKTVTFYYDGLHFVQDGTAVEVAN